MITYIVQPGDTIKSIAKSYKVSVEKLVLDNGLTNPDNLVVGQSIVIVYPKQTHTVKDGDSLNSIATTYHISVKQLLRNNPILSDRTYIYPGEILIIDYDLEKIGDISTNGYAYPYISKDLLRYILPYLTYLTLFTYGLTSNGELIQIDDTEIIKIAREYQVAPLMLISTILNVGDFSTELTHNILSSKNIQEHLINNIVNNMKVKDYFGLYINFGFILIEDSPAYLDFIKELTDRLAKEGFEICVALAPNIIDQSGVIYKGHDYEGLGKAATAILLMTYDWGKTLGPTTSVAPIPMMRQVFDYSITKIPPAKTYIGIPTFGYDWTLQSISGITIVHYLSNNSAINLAIEKEAVIQYDDYSQSPFYFYEDSTNHILHIVWFEDARSVDAKLKLVTEYGFRGISILNVMEKFPQFWFVLNTQYNIRNAI
ncbi:LysM peptidoglycan-binding domain-containing protein [Anaeromicropila herbilytica]|uniref:Germination protein n=1 Tax=Anaeromicropila herbilytica TaxID=2785025 RepID=A0A7R7IB53_9FIRM|nr:LysM peptidoglycan-binding domain-containing protein [Anaeromicropila herbilytica]BCN29208.1 germination protein [Anaeromicropila herbilytica]